jgi:hypothetical protein
MKWPLFSEIPLPSVRPTSNFPTESNEEGKWRSDFCNTFDGLGRQPLQKLVCEAYIHGIMAGEALRFDGIDTDALILE